MAEGFCLTQGQGTIKQHTTFVFCNLEAGSFPTASQLLVIQIKQVIEARINGSTYVDRILWELKQNKATQKLTD